MGSKTRTLGLFIATAVLCGLSSSISFADDVLSGLIRTELKRSDLTGSTDTEVITAILEVPVGATFKRHFHHGDEAFYVLEGTMVQAPGQEPTMLKTGFAGYNKRDVPHAGIKVVGDKALKLLTVHVVDKGKPLFPEAPSQ